MPKISPKPNRAMLLFLQWIREKNRKYKSTIETVEELIDKYWVKFAEQNNANLPPPKSRKPVDPMKQLEKAMSKVSDHVNESKGDSGAMEEIKSKLAEATPSTIKQILLPDSTPLADKLLPSVQQVGHLLQNCLTQVTESETRAQIEEAHMHIHQIQKEIHKTHHSNHRKRRRDETGDDEETEDDDATLDDADDVDGVDGVDDVDVDTRE
jgi:hypothetical protein